MPASADRSGAVPDDARLRTFWDRRYATFSLSESGWLGAGDGLNAFIYRCKARALRRALHVLGRDAPRPWSVLDAGCGQGFFASLYLREFPQAHYTGVDISERAITHLRQTIHGATFHAGDICTWTDPRRRRFDVIQSFEVLHLILDDQGVANAIAHLSSLLAPGGAMLMTAVLPGETIQPSGYVRYRSRRFWMDAVASCGLRVVASRPIYYWLPDGGPHNRYCRFVLNQAGPRVLYAIDRAALTLGIPRPRTLGLDSRMQLLTLKRSG